MQGTEGWNHPMDSRVLELLKRFDATPLEKFYNPRCFRFFHRWRPLDVKVHINGSSGGGAHEDNLPLFESSINSRQMCTRCFSYKDGGINAQALETARINRRQERFYSEAKRLRIPGYFEE